MPSFELWVDFGVDKVGCGKGGVGGDDVGEGVVEMRREGLEGGFVAHKTMEVY